MTLQKGISSQLGVKALEGHTQAWWGTNVTLTEGLLQSEVDVRTRGLIGTQGQGQMRGRVGTQVASLPGARTANKTKATYRLAVLLCKACAPGLPCSCGRPQRPPSRSLRPTSRRMPHPAAPVSTGGPSSTQCGTGAITWPLAGDELWRWSLGLSGGWPLRNMHSPSKRQCSASLGVQFPQRPPTPSSYSSTRPSLQCPRPIAF